MSERMQARWMLLAMCIVGCNGTTSDVPQEDAGLVVDAGPTVRLPDDERLPRPVPDAPRYHLPVPFALSLVVGHAEAIDSCVACQYDMFGIRCSRREGCESSDCVLYDGTRLALGHETDVDLCLHCRCDATGPVCNARDESTCAAGCPYHHPESGDLEVVPFGEQRAMSETSLCACDLVSGFTNCHTIYTECEDGTPEGQRAAHPSGCGSCLCVNGYLSCDRRGCE